MLTSSMARGARQPMDVTPVRSSRCHEAIRADPEASRRRGAPALRDPSDLRRRRGERHGSHRTALGPDVRAAEGPVVLRAGARCGRRCRLAQRPRPRPAGPPRRRGTSTAPTAFRPAVTTIEATTAWDGHNWVATSPTVGGAVTQARQLDELPDRLAEAVRLMTGESIDVAQISLRLIRYGT